ncbi:MAG: amidophosphoribosyltransferase, partial [Candidatus Korarchaeota archaeon]|nr:amidophosphoribosyltransferase [Candidatus Korarchaeota archaeon]NIU85046.1 amidophosphoribosyltransferase [Candidatus Thorarchaeota archaeon]NIW15072.1 amidophosphoribosyltransferase [Candidatus Thorarchaeota archaeon]NIW53082.1 amidophosphoribosyltransferase [Candidatus Korarchaeota archaeon]
LQPPFPYKNVVLSHNGNILNMNELSDQRWEGDGQFLAWYLQNLIEEQGLVEGVRTLMQTVDGSYSVSGILDSEKIFAFRDPRGIRPLVFGKNSDAFAFASETLPLRYLDFNLQGIRDVHPGELIVIENEAMESYQLFSQPHKHCAFEWVYFSSPSSLIEGKLIYEVRKHLGKHLEKLLRSRGLSGIDYRTEVPDTSRPAVDAMSLAERAEMVIRDRYISGRTFIMRSQEERELKAKVKYNFNPIPGAKNILVVDDSIVRGTTMREIVASLRKAHDGAKINVASTFPPIRYPCYYGIDFASKGELIAADKSIEEIKEELDADTLTYMTKERLKNAIGFDDLCTACINGDFPTEKGKAIYKNPRGNERDYEAD